MFRIDVLHFVSWMVSIPFSSAFYDEMYRPQLHYSPPKGMLADPNGLIYENGIYHLFYQARPYHVCSGQAHWGHAISSDLIHWKSLDTALTPPDGFHFFSGGAIFDHKNLTGLRASSKIPTLLLFPTAANRKTHQQDIFLAYSNDGPEYNHFEYYENNPVIPGPGISRPKAFRDPIFFKYEDYYVSIVGAYNRVQFYNSRDLLKWKFVSEFGENEGSHAGRWECPALIPFRVSIIGKQVEKYVMLITLTDYEYPSLQYFIGSYDGKKFTNDNSKETILWHEHGPDSLAGITFNQLPDGRHIFISWMCRWEYAAKITFNVWNGQTSLPREMNLIQIGGQRRLASLPVREIESLRTNHVRSQNITIKNEYIYEIADTNKKKHLADIEMMLDLKNLKAGDAFDIVFSGKKDELKITFKENEFILDRTRSGKTDIPSFKDSGKGNFDDSDDETVIVRNFYGDLWKAPRVSDSFNMKLRIIIDTSSIEMFADDGLTVMSALFFSEEGITSKMNIQVHPSSRRSQILLKELNVYELKSIWHKGGSYKKRGESSSDTKKRKLKIND